MRQSLIGPVSLIAFYGCAHAPPAAKVTAPSAVATDGATKPARYAVVHVDHMRAGALGPFAAARKRWLGVLGRHGTTDGRGLFLQTGDSGFLSLRPFRSLGDIDGSPAATRAALAEVDPKDLKAYDEASDALLVPPHRSEIWTYDPDFSFGVTDPMVALAGAAWGKMTVEEIDPTPAGEGYDTAWKETRAALEHEAYPLVRVSYWSRYGTGNLVSFWLAKSQDEFLHTKSVDDTIVAALGPEKANDILTRQRKAVLANESVDVMPRGDLSSKPL